MSRFDAAFPWDLKNNVTSVQLIKPLEICEQTDSWKYETDAIAAVCCSVGD